MNAIHADIWTGVGRVPAADSRAGGLGGQAPPEASSGPGVEDRVDLSAEGIQRQAGPKADKQLTPEEQRQVADLRKRDGEVKAHEQAHMAAGGGVVQGGATYQYAVGPDGKRYAVGGEVKIDASPERTPEATISKMQQVRSAALAPAQPSGTDRAVAARATQVESQARMEKAQALAQNLRAQDGDAPLEKSESRYSPLSPSTGNGRLINLMA